MSMSTAWILATENVSNLKSVRKVTIVVDVQGEVVAVRSRLVPVCHNHAFLPGFIACLTFVGWKEKMMTKADLYQYCFLHSQIFKGTFFSLL